MRRSSLVSIAIAIVVADAALMAAPQRVAAQTEICPTESCCYPPGGGVVCGTTCWLGAGTCTCTS
jgi:hypothetical protein